MFIFNDSVLRQTSIYPKLENKIWKWWILFSSWVLVVLFTYKHSFYVFILEKYGWLGMWDELTFVVMSLVMCEAFVWYN